MLDMKLQTLKILLVLIWGRQVIAFKEGDVAELKFQYEIPHNIDVSLRMGFGTPFYKDGVLLGTELNESQRKRFSVNVHSELHGTTPFHEISLKINDVRREDARTYHCEVYKDGQKLSQYTKALNLNVDFPPGNVSCTPSTEKRFMDPDDSWGLLSCSALLGNIPGFISCYQNGKVAAPWNEQIQNVTHLIQEVWIQQSYVAFCCSSPYSDPVSKCKCTQFKWVPRSARGFNALPSPCEHTKDNHKPVEQLVSSPNPDVYVTTAYDIPVPYQYHVYIVNTIIVILTVILMFALRSLYKMLEDISKQLNELAKIATKHKDKEESTSIISNLSHGSGTVSKRKTGGAVDV